MPLRTLTSARAGCLGSLPRDVSAGARGGGCLPWRLMRCWGAGARLRFPGASRRCAGRTATASPPGSGLRRPSPVVNIRNALGQVSVVQGPGLPFEGPLGPGADARRRAADLPGDAGQGAVRRGGEPGGRGGAGEGEHAVLRGPPGAGARAHQVAEDLVRGLRVLTDPGGGCLPGHAGRQAGRHEIAAATGVYFRGLVHAPHYQ